MMKKLSLVELTPVERTLTIPLFCRIRESQRQDGLLYDERALSLVDCFEEDVFVQAAKMSRFDQTTSVMRARKFDSCARQFLGRNPKGMVVDIGCGLDTRFDRLDNGTLIWYGIDLPEVIQLRRSLLPETERSHTMASSALDPAWLDRIEAEHRPVIFLAEGLFPYFTEQEIRGLISMLAACFPGSELVFDALSSLVIKARQLPGQSTADVAALVRWGVDNPHVLEQWGAGVQLLEVWFYYQDEEPRLGWFNLTRHIPFIGQAGKILHYRLGITS